MEDKNVLENEALEQAAGGFGMGGLNSKFLRRLYCSNCLTYVKEGVMMENAEYEKSLCEQTHECPSGKGPCISIESYPGCI